MILVTDQQHDLLNLISRSIGRGIVPSIQEVADELGVTRGSVSRRLKDLEKKDRDWETNRVAGP